MDFDDKLVSGAPQEIYAPVGSLFEYHEIVSDPGRAGPAGIRYLFELFPGAYYRYIISRDMVIDADHPRSRQLLKHYNASRHCHAAASVVLQLGDAIIHNNIVHAQAGGELRILYESFRFPDRTFSQPLPAWLPDLPVAQFQQADRPCLYLGSAGSFNYGHWLVDDLPRARAWLELRRRTGVECLVVMPTYGSTMDAIRLESLRLLIDPAIEVQFVPVDQPCRLRNLHYVTPVTFHPRIKNPAAMSFLRQRTLAGLPPAERDPFRRLFISRRPPNTRLIVNFNEVWAFLAARGFEIVEPEGLDFAGQATLFRDAQVVVGQMGAAMTNTVFCRPATNVVYLAPIGWNEPFYLDLATVGGQQYDILAGPIEGDGPAHLSDFTVPVDHLYHRLTFQGFRSDSD